MPVDSLLDMARRAIARYANGINDVGDLPYELVKPALLKIESPEKLYNLEKSSPQIIGHDRECWINFLKRDVPNWQTKRYEPANPEYWYKAYRKLKKEADDEMNRGEDTLKAALAGLQQEREKNTSKILDRPHPRPKKGWGPSVKSMSLMDKIKLQGREARKVQNNIMASHKKTLTLPATRVEPPPRFLAEARKQAVSPPPAVTWIRAPRGSRPPMHAPITKLKRPEVEEEYDIVKDREARLLAMKSRATAQSPGNDRENLRANSTGSSASPMKRTEPDKPLALSSGYLEDFSDDEGVSKDQSKLLKPPIARSRSTSPARVGSPKPVLKRKAPPSLFMSPKKPMLKRPGVL